MTTNGFSFLRARNNRLGIPMAYFWIVFIVCIIPTLFSLLKIDLTYDQYQIISFEKKPSLDQGLGKTFTAIWVLFSIATGFFTCILTLIDFRVKKDVSAPIIGLTLFSTAIIDMMHLLITTETLKLQLNFQESIYISWFFGRTLHASFLTIGTGIILIIKLKWIRKLDQKILLIKILGLFFLITTIISIIYIFSITSLSEFFIYKPGFITHSSEFITLTIYLLWGAVIMPKVIKVYPSIFSQLLIISMIPAIFSAIHMAISYQSFDSDFNFAQFLKLFAYVIPLIGISLNYSRSISKQNEVNIKLDREIKEKEKIQHDLEYRQNLLKHAESLANLGSWELNVSTKKIFWSDSLYKIFGIPSQSVKPDLKMMTSMLTEEYRAEFEAGINEAITSNQAQQTEYQILRADGSKRFILGQYEYNEADEKVVGTCLDITELKIATQKLEHNEALLKEAESISHNGSFEWFNGIDHIFCSDELYRIHGFKPHSITIDIGLYKTLIHPEDLNRCETTLIKAFKQNKRFLIEYRIIRPNNEVRYLYGNARVIKDKDGNTTKIVGTIQDITELKNTAILLEKTESIYKTIAKNVPDAAVLMFDNNFNLILSDGPIVRSLSFKTHPSTGINLKALYNENAFEKVKNHLEKAFNGSDTQYEEEINSKSYKIDYKPVKNITGEIFSVMMVIHDITEIKLAQKELESKVEELNRSNQDLEQFAYVASHDLQEPLRKIRAFGDRLQNKYSTEISEAGLDYIKRMQSASERMQTLIDDLLTFSRVTRTGEGFIEVDLHEQIQKILEDLELSIEKKNATIDIIVNHKIEAVPGQIRQLFLNLISNAIKFTKEDVAPVIEIKSEILKGESMGYSNLNPDKDYCLMTIKDNGIGFDDQYSDKIFELFQRLHTRTEYQGTGIGLAVCKKIVEKHNGQIHVSSKLNEGTVFTLIFPLTQ